MSVSLVDVSDRVSTLESNNSSGSVQLIQNEYVRAFRITDNSMSSINRFTLTGTIGNVVVGVLADIITGHSGDIHIHTESNAYTSVDIKVISTNNEDFDLYIKYTTGDAGLILNINVFSQSGGIVEFNPTASPYTGTELIHTTGTGDIRYSQSSGNVDIFTDGNIYSAGNLVYHTNNKPTISEIGALGLNAKAVDSDKLDGLNSTSFLRSDVNSSTTGDLHVGGKFSVSGDILTKRYIQIIAVERDSIIKDRVNYVGDITLPFNCTVIELRAKTDSGTTLVEFVNNSLTMTTINATSAGSSTSVLQNAPAPKFSPLTFNTTASSGSGLTITITVQEEL